MQRRSSAASAASAASAPKSVQQDFFEWRVPPLRVGAAELLPPPLARAAPPADDPFAKIGHALGAAKGRFDSIPENDFRHLMRAVDSYTGLKSTLRKEYGLEVATNASLKIYEILSQMQLLPSGAERFQVF